MKKLTAKDVMTEHVLTAKADWPISRLAEFLIENNISGAPVTSEEDILVGVVSLTDVVRYMSFPGREPSHHVSQDIPHLHLENRYALEELATFRIGEETSTTVRDIMTPSIYNVNEYTTTRRIAEIMLQGHIHRLFVTRDNSVVGVITALDLLRIITEE